MNGVDLVVVGGGPAGLATAIHGRLAGLRVSVLERSAPPIDRACGEGVMPEGAAQLEKLGVRIAPDQQRPFSGVRYVEGDLVAEGSFHDRAGLGIRRTVLHRALVERAAELGVDLRWKTVVNGLTDGGVATDGGEISGRWIVGADGRSSRVRSWAGLDGAPPRAGRYGVRRHYRIAPWSDRVEVHWGSDCEAYVTPVGPELVGVALMWSGSAGGFDDVLERLTGLAMRVSDAPRASRDAGAGPFGGRARRASHSNVALVGDAACCLDPITGEGISLALQASEALVSAVSAGDLHRYRIAHERIVRAARTFNRMVLLLGRLPRFRARVVRVLAVRPDQFDRLLAARRGSLGATAIGLLRLSLGLLAEGR